MDRQVFLQCLRWLRKPQKTSSQSDKVTTFPTKEIFTGKCCFYHHPTNKYLFFGINSNSEMETPGPVQDRTEMKFKLEVRLHDPKPQLYATFEEQYLYIIDHSQIEKITIKPSVEEATRITSSNVPTFIRMTFTELSLQYYPAPSSTDWKNGYTQLYNSIEAMFSSLKPQPSTNEKEGSSKGDHRTSIEIPGESLTDHKIPVHTTLSKLYARWLSVIPALTSASTLTLPHIAPEDKSLNTEEAIATQLDTVGRLYSDIMLKQQDYDTLQSLAKQQKTLVQANIDNSLKDLFPTSLQVSRQGDLEKLTELHKQMDQAIESELLLELLPAKYSATDH